MITAPDAVAQSTIAALESAAVKHQERPFIIDGDQCLSFQETLDKVRNVAAGLLARGFMPGQHGALWGPNSADWIVAALAIQYLGGTLVTLNTRYKPAEAAAILRASGATTLFAVETFLEADYLSSLDGHDCGALTHRVAMTSNAANGVTTLEQLCSQGKSWLDDADHLHALAAARATVSADTPSDILFTSGTTGAPKGVITRHGQNLQAFTTFADLLGLDAEDRYLIINPFFHSFGYKAGWLAALIKGASVFPMPVFDVHAVASAIARHRITVMPGPPTLFQSLLLAEGLDVSQLKTLRKATTGAATIPTQLIVDMQETLGIDTVLTAYGLSESCGLATMCRHGDSPELIATTSGRAIPGIEVAIMDGDGNRLAADESGEIVIRGFNVMAGYLDNPAATAEAIDSEGWLHTGDVGRVDAAGNLTITDRLKDMYICGGFNCYPAEIENQLLAHPAIAQVAVTGAPDERLGEVGAAFYVPAAGESTTAEALHQWSREQMANFKVPRYFIAVEALPLNASGKVLKTELRKQLPGQSS